MIEKHVNPRNDYVKKHRVYTGSAFPDAMENKTRTLEEDLVLAETLKNDFNAFCEWYAIEGFYYARKAHNIIRKTYNDRDDELGNLFFDVWSAIKAYGRRLNSTEHVNKIISLKRFVIHCCCRRLCTLATRWRKHGRKFVSLQTDDLAFERGIPDNSVEIPELIMMLNDFIETCKERMSSYECLLFCELLQGYKLTEICERWNIDGTGSVDYRSLDNAFQRISRKLNKDKKLVEMYKYISEKSEHLRRINDVGHDEIWQWVSWQFRMRERHERSKS